MRSPEEIQDLLTDIEHAMAGGIISGDPREKLPLIEILVTILRWVLGEDNQISELARSMDAVNKWPTN